MMSIYIIPKQPVGEVIVANLVTVLRSKTNFHPWRWAKTVKDL